MDKQNTLFKIIMLNLLGAAVVLAVFLVLAIIRGGGEDTTSTPSQEAVQSQKTEASAGHVEQAGGISQNTPTAQPQVEDNRSEGGRLYESKHVRIRFREAEPPKIERGEGLIEPPTLPDYDRKM